MYLHHFTPGKLTGKEQPALKSAHNIYKWLKDHTAAATQLVETPQITTQGASMLEKLKEHKPHWIIFQINVNVLLPLMHLIIKLHTLYTHLIK